MPYHDCNHENGGCDHECEEDKDDEWCSCREGFNISTDDWRKCVDIDECLGDEGVAIDKDCHTCKNTQGSYTCECDEGYERHPNEKMCIDVDECERELYDVGCHTCINLIGGHTCLCNETFILDTNMNNETCMGQPGKTITSSFDGGTIGVIVGLVVFLVLTAFALFATVIFVRQRKKDKLISRHDNLDDISRTTSHQDEVIRGVPNVTAEQAPPLFAIKAETAKRVATPKPNLKPKPTPEENLRERSWWHPLHCYESTEAICQRK
ncbi:hypothetical protein CAPTEDRAFT_214503 [Capitella teleta]|uniref:EGF-like domain-containing protein n=1 Tax=Capitella teleta TaxID=283909 RepID=R7UYH3_CAPTE|nr:hypothetical protein CAPTEDRAFT_214503 [Capitella teleta]|eukprot:ELU11369.1 hypothetical protein CAPTEDRAFT_214503 [Capitella teleta]